MRNPWRILSFASFAAGLLAVASAGAAENVKIGVIYPLTGNAASAGQSGPSGSYGIGFGGLDAKAALFWAFVGIPLAWGVWKTL